jgi:protein TonB
MSQTQYINDDFGNKIPLLDDSGNLSLQVIMLYTEDKLTSADRKIVDDFVATDEFSKDALEGYALTSNASKTRYAVSELNSSIQKRSGAKAVSSLLPQEKPTFDYRKLAAAVAILIVVGGGTFFITQFIDHDEVAIKHESKMEDTTEEMVPQKESVYQPADTSLLRSFQGSDKEPQEIRSVETKSISSETQKNKDNVPKGETLSDISLAEENEIVESDKDDLQRTVTANQTDEPTEPQNQVEMGQTVNNENRPEQPSAVAIPEDLSDGIALDEVADTEKELEKQRLALEQSRTERKRKAEESASEATQAALLESAAIAAEQAELEADYQEQSKAAQFPGGDIKMYKFIERKKNYTQAMQSQGLAGAVTITFDIEPDGRVTNARVKRGINGLLDEDALRIVRSMPKWSPAKEGGQNVKSTRSVVVKYGD